MTQEDKRLLFIDLCARLPYGIRLKIGEHSDYTLCGYMPHDEHPIKVKLIENEKEYIIEVYIEHIKPYLRPMSSMTEEEFESLTQYSGLIYNQLDLASFQNGTYKCLDFYLSEIPSYVVILVFDWLNTHHFDYRGLIERELALEASEGMYKTE